MATVVKSDPYLALEGRVVPPGPQANTDLAYIPSKYSKAFNSYSRSQIKFVMPFLASISRTCTLGPLYPVCKVMKAVSKIFMLNEIEVIFLAYLIKETNWDLRDKTIYTNADSTQDIVCYSIDNPDYKRLILYLMVTAYTVKYYLNEKTSQLMEQATRRCPNFKQIFQSWAKKHSDVTTKINPRTLNSVYKRLYSNQRQEQPDYNMMVDAIIQISPAYNPERQKAGEKQKDKKKVKKEPEPMVKKEEPMIKHERSGFIPTPPMFSSSGIMNMVARSHQQQGYMAVNPLSGLNPFMAGRSGQMNENYFGSSLVGGLQPNYALNEDVEGDCGQLAELVVGLQEGQSQENILYDDKGNQIVAQGFGNQRATNSEDNPPQTSVILLARGNSITEKYLAEDNEYGSLISLASRKKSDLPVESAFKKLERQDN